VNSIGGHAGSAIYANPIAMSSNDDQTTHRACLNVLNLSSIYPLSGRG